MFFKYFIHLLFIEIFYTCFPHNDNPNVCILLTTCVNNNPERLSIYLDRIHKYLKYTNLSFYIVESSGYTFPEFKNNPRVKIYSFIGEKSTNSSLMELDSIIRIIKHYNLNKYDFIFKITGKYFIRNLDFLVRKFFHKDIDFYIQNGNSEIFCSKPAYYFELYSHVKDAKSFEQSIPLVIKNKNKIHFPKIKLSDYTPRGDGVILKYL
jgi:hypothetical protein